jgi:hypothetical protein
MASPVAISKSHVRGMAAIAIGYIFTTASVYKEVHVLRTKQLQAVSQIREWAEERGGASMAPCLCRVPILKHG